MSKKKGVTKEEKLKRAVEFFHEKREPFAMKELQTKLSKEKGIVQQSVEEVIKELTDDNIVEKEKIGTNVLYWSFPAKAKQVSLNKVNSLKQQLKEQQAKAAELQEKTEELSELKKPSASRTAKKQRLAELQAQSKELDSELNVLQQNDPKKIEEMEEKLPWMKDQANRWVDNVCAVQNYLRQTMNMDSSQISAMCKEFGLPQEAESFE